MLTPPGGGGGGPASSSASQPASSNNVYRVSPISMIVSELGVMSEFSTDTEADLEDKLRQLQLLPVPAPMSPVSTVPSLRWVESPSSYPAPAVPVIFLTATSTVTSVHSSGTMDAFPPYVGLSGPAHVWAGFGCDASATGGPVAFSWFGNSHAGGAGILR